jgi:zinc transport system substrate-binding protein
MLISRFHSYGFGAAPSRLPALLFAATLLVLGASFAPGYAAQGNDVPRVLASIKPVQSLAASVMAGVGTPELLIEGAASPHSYALKPTDAGKIAKANIIFWVGPEMETVLEKPLATLGAQAQRVALINASGVTRLPARRGGLWEPDEDEHDANIDGHMWLDPRNGIAMVRAIAETLAKADPTHAARYRANAQSTIARLTALDTRLTAALEPAAKKPYIVFHDAYHYLEARYGLSPAGAVTVAPDRPYGPRRISEIRDRIANGKVVCVFSEPEFPPKLLTTLTEDTGARIGTLDDLGSQLSPGPMLYETVLENLARDLRKCLLG